MRRCRRSTPSASHYSPTERRGPSPTYGQVELLKSLSDDVIDSLVDAAHEYAPPLLQIEVQHLGGALARRTVEDGAVQSPQAPYLIHPVAPITPQASVEAAAIATNDAFAGLSEATTGEAYLNLNIRPS